MNTRRTHWIARGSSALALLALLAGCKNAKEHHEHASDHPPGHDHHEKGHGHGDTPVVRITRWSEHLELFAEHPAAAAGKEIALLAHLTALDDFHALDGAQLRLELSGPATVTAEVKAAVRPGIYRIPFVLPRVGSYRGRLVVAGSLADTVDDLVFEAFDNDEQARASVKDPHDEDRLIEFLKEQQWGVPFGTVSAKPGTLIESIEVAGTVTTPPGGSAEIGAPIAGRLIAPTQGLPRPGETVRKGQVLATLAPAPASPEAAAQASLTVSEADARLAKARAAAQRAERLIRDQAISEREAEDARREIAVAEEGLRSARAAQQIFTGATGGAGAGSWRLVAPIDGTLVDVLATPGASVAQGTALFRVVDTRELWIRARVPEQDAARLRSDRDASFQIAGLEDFLPIHLTGADASASLVTVGRIVDATSRTVDVIYSLRTPDPRLRVGGLVRVSLPAGDDFTGVAVPRSAVVDDDGREIVYVQVDGEHFEERQVRTGPRQGNLIGVSQGLTGDERLVVRGTHIIRLASRASSAQPHGHIH